MGYKLALITLFTLSITSICVAALSTPPLSAGVVGSTPNSGGVSIAGGVMTLQPADATNPGILSTTTQTIAGAKTFASDVNLASGKYLKYNTVEALISDASNNTFIGISSGNTSLSGASNMGVGNGALHLVSTGQNNVAVGINALYSDAGGSDNVGIGTSALVNNTGNVNVAIGSQSLFNAGAAYHNIAIGYYAQNTTTTGQKNVSVGSATLYNLTTGDFNVAVGYNAGYNAGLVTNTINNLTMIGANTYSNANALTNSTALGQGAVITASNQMVFGDTSVTANVFHGDVKGDSVTVVGSGTAPTCNSGARGKLYFITSGAGVGDILQMCAKGTADTYSWVTVKAAP